MSYEKAADLHRPTDPALVAQAIRRLAADGLSAAVIGYALRFDPAYVQSVLAEKQEAA